MDNHRKLLGSKIHRATVTKADLNYEGSITLPPELLKAADLRPYEAVQIWDVTSGARLETYAIEGNNAHDICINGAAAHLVKAGDIVIIARFIYVSEADSNHFEPKIVFVDKYNQVREIRKEEVSNGTTPANTSTNIGKPIAGSSAVSS